MALAALCGLCGECGHSQRVSSSISCPFPHETGGATKIHFSFFFNVCVPTTRTTSHQHAPPAGSTLHASTSHAREHRRARIHTQVRILLNCEARFSQPTARKSRSALPRIAAVHKKTLEDACRVASLLSVGEGGTCARGAWRQVRGRERVCCARELCEERYNLVRPLLRLFLQSTASANFSSSSTCE